MSIYNINSGPRGFMQPDAVPCITQPSSVILPTPAANALGDSLMVACLGLNPTQVVRKRNESLYIGSVPFGRYGSFAKITGSTWSYPAIELATFTPQSYAIAVRLIRLGTCSSDWNYPIAGNPGNNNFWQSGSLYWGSGAYDNTIMTNRTNYNGDAGNVWSIFTPTIGVIYNIYVILHALAEITPEAYINGVKTTPTLVSGTCTGGVQGETNMTFNFGSTSDGSSSKNFAIEYAYGMRNPSAQQAMALYQNPWQVFAEL